MNKHITAALALLTLTGCVATRHPTTPSTLGTARSSDALVQQLAAQQPGPLTLETVDSATWAVPLSGLVNLEHERAKEAGLVDADEPIVVPFHVIKHPKHGMFIVDTGVQRDVLDPERAAVRGIVADVMGIQEKLTVKRSLGAFLDEQQAPLAGVFLTHIHMDHVMGLPDVPKGTPIYAGPGEPGAKSFDNLVVGPNLDRAFEGHGALREWAYGADAGGRFDGVVDVFGDGSLWALWVPGHTPGSTAYLAFTTTGPVLLTGDASHTRWGWDHDVEPGTYNGDPARATESFRKLRAFAAQHANVEVCVGHQH